MGKYTRSDRRYSGKRKIELVKEKNMKRVVITVKDALTPISNSVDEFWSHIKRIIYVFKDIQDFTTKVIVLIKQVKL